jgi:SAM-dependent methyltransferase
LFEKGKYAMNAHTEWWSTFFSGLFLDAQRNMFPPERTRAEADFILNTLGKASGARLLDVPCGEGRVSIELAARGCQVTGVDLTPEFIEDARRKARGRGLEASFAVHDMRDLPWRGEFDAAFCFGNSFGYLDDAGNLDFLRAANRALQPGGRFILNVPIVAEALFPNFNASSWHELGDMLFLRKARHDHREGRTVSDYTLIRGDRVEKNSASYRIYTYRELSRLLQETGFDEIEAFGSTAGEPFQFGSRDCYMVATKV